MDRAWIRSPRLASMRAPRALATGSGHHGAIARAVSAGLVTWFAVLTVDKALTFIPAGYGAIDFRIYRHAARAALDGLNPWSVSLSGLQFAGPPPTLLPYLPFAIIPESVGVAVVLAASVYVGLATLRRLGLPVWWLLFPPLSESLIVLNPDVLALGLLVLGRRLAAFAPIFKVYAVIPLVLLGRWRPALYFACLCLLSAPLWPAYLARAEAIATTLSVQTSGGLSSWASPLLPASILALLMMGRSATAWLVVPIAWPYTQLHYSTIAIPALVGRPLLAAAFSLAIPLLAPAAVIAWSVAAIATRARSTLARRGGLRGLLHSIVDSPPKS